MVQEDDQERIAMLAMQLNMIAVPVVDGEGRLLGAVPPEALFRILRHEHMEDLQQLAGISPHEQGPTVALDAPLSDRFRRRLPWLVVGLFASSVITLVMAGFEDSLSANVAVAFFVPALVYIAGAIGTQAVSVAVRGLSADDVAIASLLRDEMIIGMLLAPPSASFPRLWFFLPLVTPNCHWRWGLRCLGAERFPRSLGSRFPGYSDPALGSGPICTVIQDVASLMIYFALVGILVV